MTPTPFWIALSLFFLAACGGVIMLAMRLRQRAPPKWLAIVHGAVAGTGLLCLGYTCWQHDWPGAATITLGILLTAAALGIATARSHAKLGMPKLGLALGHATIAILGLALLLATTVAHTGLADDGPPVPPPPVTAPAPGESATSMRADHQRGFAHPIRLPREEHP